MRDSNQSVLEHVSVSPSHGRLDLCRFSPENPLKPLSFRFKAREQRRSDLGGQRAQGVSGPPLAALRLRSALVAVDLHTFLPGEETLRNSFERHSNVLGLGASGAFTGGLAF